MNGKNVISVFVLALPTIYMSISFWQRMDVAMWGVGAIFWCIGAGIILLHDNDTKV